MKNAKTAAALIAALMLCACSQGAIEEPVQTDAALPEAVANAVNEPEDVSEILTAMDNALSQEYSTQYEAGTEIIFSDGTAKINGKGAKAVGSVATITAAGIYKVSGSTSDGQLIVNAAGEDKVTIILNGADITSKTGAALYSKKAGVTTVYLEKGTVNALTDAAQYTQVDENGDPDAALFVKNDLVISGEGTLNVTSSGGNGIGAKDDLTILSGTVNVTSEHVGIRGRDAVIISGGNITVNSHGDGIRSNNDEDTSKGWVSVSGGNITINTPHDGIQAETAVKLTGGNIDITTTGNEEDSAKGIKAKSSVIIEGGVFSVSSYDDAVHSGADIVVSGGDFVINTGDDAFHADASLTVKDASIDVQKSYEGLEAAAVTIEGGSIKLVSSDDGINAAGGADSSNSQGKFSPDSFKADASCFVKVTGGEVYINASGDGIDSNGGVYLAGGSVTVDGPTAGDNSPIDFAGELIISGGNVGAAGSSEMAEKPSDSSTQNSVMIYLSEKQSGGTEVTLLDKDGNVILSVTPKKDFACVLFSSPEIKTGESYTVKYSEISQSITISSRVTTVGQGGHGMGMAGGMDFPSGEKPARPDGMEMPFGDTPPTKK